MEKKHIQQVQTLKCKKCNSEANNIISMKDHEASMAHNMSNKDKACTNGNISQCRWARQGRCMFRHEREIAPNVEKVKECTNGDACKFKAQGRCYHYHSDIGVQTEKPKNTSSIPQPGRQTMTVPPVWQQSQQQQNIQPTQNSHIQYMIPPPINQWQTVPTMWQHSNQQQLRHSPPTFPTPPPSGPPQAWCTHGKACNLGRFCLLRHFSDEDFLQLQNQRRN